MRLTTFHADRFERWTLAVVADRVVFVRAVRPYSIDVVPARWWHRAWVRVVGAVRPVLR